MSLNNFFDYPNLNAIQARWLDFLSEFYFEIKHIKTNENKVADSLRIKLQVIALSMCKSYLRTRVPKTQNKDETYIRI